MNGITSAQALDLVATTLNNIPRGSFTQTFALNSYPVCELLFGGGRITADSGSRGREKRIRLAENESARGTRMYATQSYAQVDTMGTLFEPWVMHEAHYIIDKSEVARNRGAAQIVDLVQTRRDACYESIANYFENRGLLPPDNAADDLNPKGLLFHCRPLAAGQVDPVGGFNGINAVFRDGLTTSLVGGIDASIPANSRLRNWAATHNGAIDPQLIRQLRTAVNRVGWRPPKNMKLTGGDTTQRQQFAILWSQPFAEAYADMVNAGPDDRNGNASPFFGDLPFGPVTTYAVPALDSLAYQPICGVNMAFTKLVALRGEWMLEDEPVRGDGQRRVMKMGVDSQYCIMSENPRANFILHAPRATVPF
ncbi:MAG: hypothetical protein LW650_15380 [Planctomycetaceae bacterium]|jgi:hypothetical protein|nr:hypothetical protein [Planctomycetaceae bacterium]